MGDYNFPDESDADEDGSSPAAGKKDGATMMGVSKLAGMVRTPSSNSAKDAGVGKLTPNQRKQERVKEYRQILADGICKHSGNRWG